MKILITVKTYPLPSESHRELVCTAGVKEDGSFIRLYPVDYRYQPFYKWYHKYQWIDVDVERNTKDPRPETYRPKMDTLKILGKPIDSKNNWSERKKFVLAQGTQTMCSLQEGTQDLKSLGIIRPNKIWDFISEPAPEEWKPQWKNAINQLQLMGPQIKPLEKIPYKFSYVYTCEESQCNGHKMMIEDWEIGELFRTMQQKYGKGMAPQKVRDKFLGTLCHSSRDPHFYVGTILKHGTWVILGVFWPKKE